jgi:hypothetical protein
MIFPELQQCRMHMQLGEIIDMGLDLKFFLDRFHRYAFVVRSIHNGSTYE